MISYEELVGDKRAAMHRLTQALEYWLTSERQEEIIASTEPDVMRVTKKEAGLADHMTLPEHKLARGAFRPYHCDMINLVVHANAPRLLERLGTLGYGWILSPDDAGPKLLAEQRDEPQRCGDFIAPFWNLMCRNDVTTASGVDGADRQFSGPRFAMHRRRL